MKVDIEELMQTEMRLAIEQKRRNPKDDDFKMRIQIVGPGGSVADVPLQWTSHEDKERKMFILSLLCGKVSAVAAIVTTDTRRLHSENFCKQTVCLPAWQAYRHSLFHAVG